MNVIAATNQSAQVIELVQLTIPDRELPIGTPVELTKWNTTTEIIDDDQLAQLIAAGDVVLTIDGVVQDQHGSQTFMSSVYGLFCGDAYEASEVRITGDTEWHTVAQLPVTVSDGRYRIGWSYEWFLSSNKTRMLVRVSIGETTLADGAQSMVIGNQKDATWNPAEGFGYVDLVEGDYTIDIAIAMSKKKYEVGAQRRRLEVWRVS